MTQIKRMLAVLAILMLGFSTHANASTEITFWTTEVGADRQAVIKYLAETFTIFNPDIQVRVVGVEENSMVDAVIHGRRMGGGPDLISCSSDLTVSFSRQGWVDSKGAQRVITGIGEERFYNGALCRVHGSNGNYYGVPFNGWVQGIWYRKDWFAEKGLAPPATWDAILKAAKALHDPKNGRYGILLGTRDDVYAEQVFTHLALSAGVQEFSEEGDVVFDSPATVRTLEFYAKLAQYTPPGPQWWRGRDYYLQGKLGMMFYSSFIMDDLALPSVAADSLTGSNFDDLKGAAYDYAVLKGTGMVSSIGDMSKASFGVVHALTLMQNGDEDKSKAVERFVNFLFSDSAYITWLHMVPGGMLPVLRDIGDRPEFYRDATGVFQRYSRQRVQGIVEGFEELKSFGFVDGVLLPQAAQATAEGVIPKMIQEVLQDGVSAQMAVSRAADKMRVIAEE